MESVEEYRKRLSSDGMWPFDKLVGVVESHLSALAKSEIKLARLKDAAFFNGLALLAVAAVIYPFEKDAFICLVPAAFGAMQAVTWYCRKTALERVTCAIRDLDRLLVHANFDVAPSEEDDLKPAIRWKRKEARLYA